MAGVEFGWRRFIFFDKSFVMDKSTGEKYVGLKVCPIPSRKLNFQDVTADCWCKNGDTVYLGEKTGGIFRLTSAYQEHFLTKAFQKTLADLRYAQGLLFSVGVNFFLVS